MNVIARSGLAGRNPAGGAMAGSMDGSTDGVTWMERPRLARLAVIVCLGALSACGGGSPKGSSMEEIPVVSEKVYVYNPNQRHAPVSLSGSDLIGLEPRVR